VGGFLFPPLLSTRDAEGGEERAVGSEWLVGVFYTSNGEGGRRQGRA